MALMADFPGLTRSDEDFALQRIVVCGKTFVADASLQEEIFGPSSLVIWCADQREVDAVLGALHGNLTATVHGTDAELGQHACAERPRNQLAQLDYLDSRQRSHQMILPRMFCRQAG